MLIDSILKVFIHLQESDEILCILAAKGAAGSKKNSHLALNVTRFT